MCNLEANPWKKNESVITDSLQTFSNGGGWISQAIPTQPPPATEWPHYITRNWPKAVAQKARKCQDKQNILTSNTPLEIHVVKP